MVCKATRVIAYVFAFKKADAVLAPGATRCMSTDCTTRSSDNYPGHHAVHCTTISLRQLCICSIKQRFLTASSPHHTPIYPALSLLRRGGLGGGRRSNGHRSSSVLLSGFLSAKWRWSMENPISLLRTRKCAKCGRNRDAATGRSATMSTSAALSIPGFLGAGGRIEGVEWSVTLHWPPYHPALHHCPPRHHS